MTTFPTSTIPQIPAYTREERRQITAETEPAERVGLLQRAEDAIDSEWSTSWFARWVQGQQMPIDPDFVLTEDLSRELTEGLSPEYWGELSKAESLTHAYYIRETMRELDEKRGRLARAGVTGTALSLGSAILDPGFIVGGVLVEASTAGLGGAGMLAAKASRVRSAVRGGLVVTAADVPIQAFISGQDPDQGTREVLYTLAGGTILGGGLGAAFPGRGARNARELRAADRLKRDIEAEELGLMGAMGAASRAELARPMDRLSEILSDKGRAYFSEQVDPAERTARVHAMIDTIYDPDRDADIIASLKGLDAEDAMDTLDEMHRLHWEGRRNTGEKVFPGGPSGKDADGGDIPPTNVTRPVGADDFDGSWAQQGVPQIPKTGANAARLPTYTTQLGRARGGLMRMFGGLTLHDDLLRGADHVIGDNAEDFIRRTRNGLMAVYNRGVDPLFRQWAESQQRRPSHAARRQFNAMVSQAVRDGGHVNPAVAKAADGVRGMHAEILDRLKSHGVEGFEDVPTDPTYLMRVWNTPEVHALDHAYGEDVLNSLIETSIRSATPDIDEDLLKKITKGFTDEIRTLDQVNNRARSAMLDGQNADALADMLRRWGLPEAEIEQILYRVTRQDPDAGKINRGKHRLRMDETASITAPDGRQISLQQLLENDIDALVGTYIHETTGAMAASEVYRVLGLSIDPAGGVRIRNWDQLKGLLIDDLRTAGHSEGEIVDLVKTAEQVDRHIRGMPMRDRVKGQDFFRRARSVGHILYSGSFGLTQQIEWGGMVGEAGIRATIRQIPELARMVKLAAQGKMPQGFIRDVEAMTGIGADHVNSRYLSHFDYKDAIDEAGKANSTTDRVLHNGSRLANYASLMIPTMVIQKRWAISLATQKWLDIASTGKIPSAKRLNLLGMDEDTARAVAEGVRKHAVTGPSTFGGRRTFRDLDLDAWKREDPRAAAAYVRTLDRWAGRVIQQGDVGSMMPWTGTNTGRVLTQFRTFVLQAWEKQFLHRAQMNDPEAYAGAAATFLTAAMVYMARTQIQSVGRADREEYLAKRMTPREIAFGAFRYSGFNSFMPDVIDSFLPDKHRLFNRASGLSSSVFDLGTTPLSAMAQNAAKAFGTAVTWPLDGQVSRDEVKAMTRLVPYRNVTGLRNILDAIDTHTPEDDE